MDPAENSVVRLLPGLPKDVPRGEKEKQASRDYGNTPNEMNNYLEWQV